MNRVTIFGIILVSTLLMISVGLYALTPDTWQTGGQFTTAVDVVGVVKETINAVPTPVQDVTVTAFTPTPNVDTTTDASGRFTISLEPGTHDFSFSKQPGYYTQYRYQVAISSTNKDLGTINMLKGNCDSFCSIGRTCDLRCYGPGSGCNVEYAQKCNNRQQGWRANSTLTCCSTDTGQTTTQTTDGQLTVCTDNIITRKIPTLYRGEPVTIIIHTFKPDTNCN